MVTCLYVRFSEVRRPRHPPRGEEELRHSEVREIITESSSRYSLLLCRRPVSPSVCIVEYKKCVSDRIFWTVSRWGQQRLFRETRNRNVFWGADFNHKNIGRRGSEGDGATENGLKVL